MLKCSTPKILKKLSINTPKDILTKSSPSILQKIFSQEALHQYSKRYSHKKLSIDPQNR
jgi:hypothetical protein